MTNIGYRRCTCGAVHVPPGAYFVNVEREHHRVHLQCYSVNPIDEAASHLSALLDIHGCNVVLSNDVVGHYTPVVAARYDESMNVIVISVTGDPYEPDSEDDQRLR